MPMCHTLWLSPLKSPKAKTGPQTWLLLIVPTTQCLSPHPQAQQDPLCRLTWSPLICLWTLQLSTQCHVHLVCWWSCTLILRVRHRRHPPSWSHEIVCISCLLFKRHADIYPHAARMHTEGSHLPSGRFTHSHAHTHTPNFLKPTLYVPAEMQGFQGICLPKGVVLDFIIQICYSYASGQLAVF